MRATLSATLAATMLAFAAPPTVATPVISGTARVIDGDTLEIGPVRIRLHGIDAPEADQSCPRSQGGTWPCGRAAADRLAGLLARGRVACEPLERDRYGRIIARCTVSGVDPAAILVAEGLAWAFRRYSDDYALAEDEAAKIGAGIWQAATEPAWVFRASAWERASAAAPNGCPIKGNINRAGERIYHTPWSPWYARTRIDEARGERWFCDEAEALAAGWRPARSR